MTAAWDDPRIARGMEAQLRRRRELLAAGHKPLGWKLAFGGPAAMERLRINAPLVGFLLQNAQLPSGSTVSISNWIKPAAEPEIAVYIAKDLPAHSSRETAIAAISALGPAIELADVDHPSDDVEGTLARDIYQRHIILGRADSARAGGRLDGLVCRVIHNGSEIAHAGDPKSLQALTGELIDIVRHTANLVAAFGDSLQAGQLIIAGSITPPLWVTSGEEITFQLAPFDSISVRFAAS
ncbi:MAG TPA: fumarylacetoacetate hydrolase family protein [Methylomirabilota bacterium]|nr:fumarylacetoacetate hydrolase family protein [Methylomirabilota bacterium]